jgi:hypothetical protein
MRAMFTVPRVPDQSACWAQPDSQVQAPVYAHRRRCAGMQLSATDGGGDAGRACAQNRHIIAGGANIKATPTLGSQNEDSYPSLPNEDKEYGAAKACHPRVRRGQAEARLDRRLWPKPRDRVSAPEGDPGALTADDMRRRLAGAALQRDSTARKVRATLAGPKRFSRPSSHPARP